MAVILETRRLRLRELGPSDLDFLVEMLGDPDVMRFYPAALDREGARRWLERQVDRYRMDGHGLWLVEEREGGEPLGQVGLIEQRLADGTHTEVGYLIHRPHQGRGYASEAALAARDHAFTVLDRAWVISLIRPENVPSRNVARKLGMTPVDSVTRAGFEHLVFRVERESTRSR